MSCTYKALPCIIMYVVRVHASDAVYIEAFALLGCYAARLVVVYRHSRTVCQSPSKENAGNKWVHYDCI